MGYLKDNFLGYCKKHKVAVIFFVVCLIVIFLTSFAQSAVQTDGWSVEVTDLRDAENSGTKDVQTLIDNNRNGTPDINEQEEGTDLVAAGLIDADGNPVTVTSQSAVKGKVVSGILFKPKSATAENPAPAVVFTHGYLNNREMQLQNAIELARRGFVVLAVDREGHGNYENSGNQNAMMATNGLYDSAKYLYNLDYVDKSRIGISGHSMGGMTTASVLNSDNSAIKVSGGKYSNGGLGIVAAGLIQSWSTFMGAGANVDVGFLKSKDDEFFYTTSENGGTISREWLSTTTAKTYVGNPAMEGDVVNGGIYVNGQLVETTEGQAVDGAIRVIYEVPGVHPQVHYSVDGAAAVIDFFYNSFGTPSGAEYIAKGSQTWWVKDMFSLIGMIALFAMIFPLVSLLLTVPFFRSLAVGKQETNAGGELVWNGPAPIEPKPLKGIQKNITYWLGAIGIMLFSGFIIHDVCTEYGGKVFPNTQLYPQDTTNWVAIWAVVVALFSLAVILFFWLANTIIYRARYKENAGQYIENPFASAKIPTGLAGLLKSFLLAGIVVFFLYLVTFVNWSAWTVDFRIWTFAIKVFDVGVMLPTMVRYAVFFGIFFVISAIFNENYRAKNLPEWASILINVFFNIFGVLLVIAIQYGQFTKTGVMWQSDMALGYIVLIPMIPILAIATVISRRMAAKTGNMWLGAFINTMLFTIITCANTAASFAYVMG